MNARVRVVVGVILLVFAWRGASISVLWPDAGTAATQPQQPSAVEAKWTSEVQKLLPRIAPGDRAYLSRFYSALEFVIQRDGASKSPVMTNTDKFAAFHGGSLRLAIDRKDVGKYQGLGEAIDQAFVAANGPDVVDIDASARENLAAACNALAWAFLVRGE
jgi:hypothetical protein